MKITSYYIMSYRAKSHHHITDWQRLVHIIVKPASDQLRQICLSLADSSDQLRQN